MVKDNVSILEIKKKKKKNAISEFTNLYTLTLQMILYSISILLNLMK